MTKPAVYTQQQKEALLAVCKCGKLSQKGVDKYTKLLDFPPQQIKGLESFDEKTHAPSILGLVQLPAYKHWTLLDALNVVALMDLKWRDPLKEKRNASKQEIDAVVAKATEVYHHFNVAPPSPAKLRAAMITRLSGFSPTKTDMAKIVRCDTSTGGIGSKSINYTVARKNQDRYEQDVVNLNEENKRKRHSDDEFRAKTAKSCHDHHRRKSTYRRIDEMNAAMETGKKYMSDAEIDAMVDFSCRIVRWPQLGGRTLDDAMKSSTLSIYPGITKQTPLSREALNFLVRGIGRWKDAVEMVPPITRPDGSYIGIPDAKAMGFFYFNFFQSTAMFDCKRFETKMQARYEHYPFVSKILFKRTGAGKNYVDTFSNHCCVYLTGIFDILDLLADGTVILGDYEKSEAYYEYLREED